MSKGLLVSFAGFPIALSSLFPDNGLASLAGTLLTHGHHVKILDFNKASTLERLVSPATTSRLRSLRSALSSGEMEPALEELAEIAAGLEERLAQVTEEIALELAAEVEALGASFVAFKLWSGDGFTASVSMAKRLRELFPGLKIFGGGPAVLYSEEMIYDITDVFDALVDGEGEQALLGLAEAIDGREDLASVPNLIISDNGAIRRTPKSFVPDLDALPPPVYDLETYPSLRGDDQVKLFVLDESRGCPRKCAFCIHRHASGHKWRIRSPEKVLAEIDARHREFGVSAFRLGGSFTAHRFLDRFIPMTFELDYPLLYSGFSHIDGLPKNLDRFRESGCVSLFFGIESFCAQDAPMLGKKLDTKKAKMKLSACQRAGIVPGISLIVPTPGMTEAGQQQNLEITFELCEGWNAVVVVTIPGLIPRTQWWDNKEKYGFSLNTSESIFRRDFASYKVRHYVPPTMWKPLPFSLDGRSFKEICEVNEDFRKQLSRRDIGINVADQDILLARVLGESIEVFHLLQGWLIASLDAARIKKLVAKVNKRLRGELY